MIETTGSRDIDQATAEIAIALRDASPGQRDQHYYDEATRLRDEIMAGTRELDKHPLRRAEIARSAIGGPTGEVVAQYLPANYKVAEVSRMYVFIEGRDNAGWTLDGYVIPRLASGLITAREVEL